MLDLLSFPTRRSSDLRVVYIQEGVMDVLDTLSRTILVAPTHSRWSHATSYRASCCNCVARIEDAPGDHPAYLQQKWSGRSEEHTSELQSLTNLVCRLL